MKQILLILLTLLIAAVPVRAGGLQLNLHGQRQLGMGYTGVAFTYDGSTSFFNPGAMSFVPGGKIQFGFSFYSTKTQFEADQPIEYSSQTLPQFFTPVYLYMTWSGGKKRFWKRTAFGLSINNPFTGGVKWEDDWLARYVAIELAVTTLFVQPTVSYKITSKLSIGAGFVFGLGNLLFRKALRLDTEDGEAEYTGFGRGFGANIGLLWKPDERFQMGLTFRSAVRIDIPDGRATFNVPEENADDYPEMSFQSMLPLPWVANIGIAYMVDDRFLLAIDINYTGWKSFDSLRIKFNRETDAIQSEAIPRDFRNAMALRIGGEYAANENLQFRGGLFFDASPVRSEFVSPDLPDATRIGVTYGMGIQLVRKLKVDLAFQYEFTGERTAIFNNSGLVGAYRSSSVVAGLGIMYSF